MAADVDGPARACSSTGGVAGSRALHRAFAQRVCRDRSTCRSSTRRRRSSSSSGISNITTPRTTSSPTSRRAPAGCATCRPCIWIARAAGLGRTWRELARQGLITSRGGARGVAAGADDQRTAHPPALPRRTARGPAACSIMQTALARELGLADTPAKRASEQLMQRYYRAAKLVRQVNMHRCCRTCTRGCYPCRRDGRSSIDDTFQSRRRAARRRATSALFEHRSGSDARRVPDAAAAPGAAAACRRARCARCGAIGTAIDAAFRRDPAQPRALPATLPRAARRARTSCGG